MALFPQIAVNDSVRKREVFGCEMYPFANSGCVTVVLTAVFGACMVGGDAGNAPWATMAWAWAWTSEPALAGGGPGDVVWAIAAVVLSNLFYSCGESLIAAFLPELARWDSLGCVSGWAWTFGYFGGKDRRVPERALAQVQPRQDIATSAASDSKAL